MLMLQCTLQNLEQWDVNEKKVMKASTVYPKGLKSPDFDPTSL